MRGKPVTTPGPGPALGCCTNWMLEAIEKGHRQAQGEGATKANPTLGGVSNRLTEVFHLSPSCKSNKLLVFLTSKTGNTVACPEDPKYSPYAPSHKAPSFPPPCRSRAALRGLRSLSSPASGSLGSRDALKKVASKEHACRAAGLAQGWRGREMESLQQGPCPH